MAMQEYKIVNATQLDADLAELASKYRDIFDISTTTPMIFPETFINTVSGIEKRNANALTMEGKNITALAGYYKENAVFKLPDAYIDTTDIVITEIPDATTIAAALPAGTSITIPTGYYPNAIVITSSQSPEEAPPAEE